MSKRSRLQWGISEVERATGKSSACDGFGQKFASDFPKLAIHG